MATQQFADAHPSAHLLQRWDERTSVDSVAPETAWANACQMRLPPREFAHNDEGRYYRDEQIVLVRTGFVIVTVYDVANPTKHTGEALQRAVEKQFGIQL